MEKEMSISNKIDNLLIKAETGRDLTRDDIITLLRLPGYYSPALYFAADRVRREQVGDEIFLRGIIEFSNHCERNCLYCGLRKGNDKLSRYRMTDDEILATAKQIKETGIQTLVLQSEKIHFIPRIRFVN
jgi:biotin synthase